MNFIIKRRDIICNTNNSVVINAGRNATSYSVSNIEYAISNQGAKKGEPHKVALIGIPLAVVETFSLKGIKGHSTKTRVVKRRIVGVDTDFFDIANVINQLKKANINLWIGNSLVSLRELDFRQLKEEFEVKQKNLHNLMTIKIGLNTAKRIAESFARIDYVEAEYNGSDVAYPVKYGDICTAIVDKAYGAYLDSYFFEDSTIKLNNKEVHSNSLLDVRLPNLKLEDKPGSYVRLVNKVTAVGVDVRVTTYLVCCKEVDGQTVKTSYELYHQDFKKSCYDENTRIRNKYSELEDLGFTVTKVIDGKSVEQRILRKKNTFVDSEYVKMIEVLTRTSQCYTEAIASIRGLVQALDWYITFNNNDGAYDWSERNQIIRYYKMARKLGLIKRHKLRLIHEPEWARYYEDSDSGADDDERATREYDEDNLIVDFSIGSIVIEINDIELETANELFKSQDYAEILVVVEE